MGEVKVFSLIKLLLQKFDVFHKTSPITFEDTTECMSLGIPCMFRSVLKGTNVHFNIALLLVGSV